MPIGTKTGNGLQLKAFWAKNVKQASLVQTFHLKETKAGYPNGGFPRQAPPSEDFPKHEVAWTRRSDYLLPPPSISALKGYPQNQICKGGPP